MKKLLYGIFLTIIISLSFVSFSFAQSESDIVIQATTTAANQTVRINNYFNNNFTYNCETG
jgi:hypothetical protein